VAALKSVLEPAFQGATAASAMLAVKDFILLVCLALGGWQRGAWGPATFVCAEAHTATLGSCGAPKLSLPLPLLLTACHLLPTRPSSPPPPTRIPSTIHTNHHFHHTHKSPLRPLRLPDGGSAGGAHALQGQVPRPAGGSHRRQRAGGWRYGVRWGCVRWGVGV
jgi:hypothetical protein